MSSPEDRKLDRGFEGIPFGRNPGQPHFSALGILSSQLPWHDPAHQPPLSIDLIGKLAKSITGVDAFIMGVDTVVGDAGRVTTRRAEEWHFSTGEVEKIPVLRLHEPKVARSSAGKSSGTCFH